MAKLYVAEGCYYWKRAAEHEQFSEKNRRNKASKISIDGCRILIFVFTSGRVSVTKKLVHTVRSENENDITLNRYKYLMLVIQTRFGVNKAKRPPFQFCETNLKLSVNHLKKNLPGA